MNLSPFFLLGSCKDWHRDKGASPEALARNKKNPPSGHRGRHSGKLV